jgi:hypothetical protein
MVSAKSARGGISFMTKYFLSIAVLFLI